MAIASIEEKEGEEEFNLSSLWRFYYRTAALGLLPAALGAAIHIPYVLALIHTDQAAFAAEGYRYYANQAPYHVSNVVRLLYVAPTACSTLVGGVIGATFHNKLQRSKTSGFMYGAGIGLCAGIWGLCEEGLAGSLMGDKINVSSLAVAPLLLPAKGPFAEMAHNFTAPVRSVVATTKDTVHSLAEAKNYFFRKAAHVISRQIGKSHVHICKKPLMLWQKSKVKPEVLKVV